MAPTKEHDKAEIVRSNDRSKVLALIANTEDRAVFAGARSLFATSKHWHNSDQVIKGTKYKKEWKSDLSHSALYSWRLHTTKTQRLTPSCPWPNTSYVVSWKKTEGITAARNKHFFKKHFKKRLKMNLHSELHIFFKCACFRFGETEHDTACP